MKKFLLVPLLAVALAGCDKKESVAKSETSTENRPADNVVTLTKENLQHVTVKTEPARLGSLGMTLKAAGHISVNLNQTARITSTLEGRITKLNFDLGDRVKAGDVMALVESPELLGKPLELKSPTDGVVIERNSAAGELLEKSKAVYTVSDPTQLWAIAEVKERDIAAVKAGQEASFTTFAYPDEPFHGKVTLISNEVEPGSRTVEVRIAVDNADGRLKPGMFADVEITTTILENVLLISDRALETDGENQIVFVALDGNKFEKRVVKLGREQSGHMQILDGVRAGENVVTDGGFILKSEMLKGELGEE